MRYELTWSDEQIAFVCARYKQPNWSASKIAAALAKQWPARMRGVTRDAVIGKANRLGLCRPRPLMPAEKRRQPFDYKKELRP